ncbi:MAG: hypothetical protein ACREQ7_18395 [Candidatus Binatia bacterium]
MATPDYASDLRALGQALEILRVERFEIDPDGKSYLVQVLTDQPRRRGDTGPSGENTVRYIWAGAPDGSRDEAIDTKLLYAMAKTLDLHYSPEEVVRLEQEWRAQRTDPNGTADPSSLSELLRTAGGYINNKGVYLLKIRRQERSLVVDYETESGEKRQEILADNDLCQASLRMLAKRKQHSGLH